MSLALVGLVPRYSVASGKLPIGTVEAAMLQRVRFDCSFLAILLALTLTTLGLGGCTSGSRPTLSSIQVSPANPSVTEGSQLQFTATGAFSDGSTQDLTKTVRWSSSADSIVTIDSAGLATTHSLGRPQITAQTDTGVGTAALVIGSTHLIIVAAAGTSTPRFAYVTNLSDDTLSIYSVNASTGQLRPNGYVLTDSHPDAVSLDPSGKFAYTANNQANDVSAFTIDAVTGSLTPVPGSPFAAGSTPFAGTVDPSGTFLYVANSGSANISAFVIDRSTGALMPVPGSPFAAGGYPNSVAIDPTGRFAFVANSSVNVPVFSIDVSTGALQPIPGSPFPAGTSGGIATLHPTGRFLYTINQNTNTVNGLTVDPATGSLGPMPGSPFPTGGGPFHFALDPAGKFAFVANGFSNTVSAYTVNAATGALSEVAGSPFATGIEPAWLTVDPSGKFLYVSGELSNDVTMYSINGTSGVLTTLGTVRARPGARAIAISGGSTPASYVPLFAYAANENSNNITGYGIDPVSGALAAVPGSPFPAGSGP